MKHRIDALRMFDVRALFGAKTIAIVGNSGIQEEDNELIDCADVVVRFNNYATRADIEYTKDRYRCDVLFTTFDLHSVHADPRVVVIGIPYPFKQDQIVRKLDLWYPKSLPFMVNPYWNAILCKELHLDSVGCQHPLPSIGMTCIWHIKKIISTMVNYNPSIFIAGFNWYSDKEKLTIQGRDIQLPRAAHFNHHYREEMQWMIRHLLNDPRFSFSRSCQEILMAFEPHLK